MRRALLIVAFVFLLAMDARSLVEVVGWIFVHQQGVYERETAGFLRTPSALSWGAYIAATLFNLSMLWLTIHVAKRLRIPASARL